MLTLWKKFKKAVNKFLEDLAKENEKAFGSNKLDCCGLNKKNGTK